MPSASLVHDDAGGGGMNINSTYHRDGGATFDGGFDPLSMGGPPSSLEHVRSSDAFPKMHPQRVSSLGELEPVAVQPPLSHHLRNNSSHIVAHNNNDVPRTTNGDTDVQCCTADNNGLVATRSNEFTDKKCAAAEKCKLPNCPFPLLPGESIYRYGPMEGGQLYLTTFRLFVYFEKRKGFYNIPLTAIDSVEVRELSGLQVTCKDGQTLRITSENSEKSLIWFKELTCLAVNPRPLEKVFAFPFHAWCVDERRQCSIGLRPVIGSDDVPSTTVPQLADFRRLRFDDTKWRVSAINEQFEICDTYPRFLIVPASIDDQELTKCANARYFKRFPAVSWRDPNTSAVLLRSSQPALGLFGWRNGQDEALLRSYLVATAKRLPPTAEASNGAVPTDEQQHIPNGLTSVVNQQLSEQCALDSVKPMLILDARSYAAAWANRAKGGGFENPEYYQKCELQFLGLANIHNIRYSFQQLRSLLSSVTHQDNSDQANWLQSLQTTQWLQYVGAVLGAGMRCADALRHEGRTVLIHCSDGWDRTAQIVSIAKLLLDPYYRTMRGFQELVEREWIEFGHKFADRCGLQNRDANERSPVFAQFLDCVHQIQSQRPTAFEFNRLYLIKLAQHTYAGLFGTFLCNSVKEREQNGIGGRTFSVWSYLHPENAQFRNVIYEPYDGALRPNIHMHQLRLWAELYLLAQRTPNDNGTPAAGDSNASLHAAATTTTTAASSIALQTSLTKAHSCDSLHSLEGTLTGSVLPTAAAAACSPPLRTGSESNLVANVSSAPLAPINVVSSARDERRRDATPVGGSKEEVNGVVRELVRRVSTSDDGKGLHAHPDALCDNDACLMSDRNATTPLPVANELRKTTTGVDRSMDFLDMCESFSVCPVSPPSNGADNDKEDSEPPSPLSSIEKELYASAVVRIVDHQAHMDTSTSEISDSLVARPKVRIVRPTRRLQPSGADSGANGGAYTVSDDFTSCLYWRARTRRKRREGSILHCIDCDGLTYIEDEEQERMRELREYDLKRCGQLESEVQRLRLIVREKQTLIECQKYGNNGFPIFDKRDQSDEDRWALPNSLESAGGYASDVSWEAVEERDVQPTRWIPDHAVTHCMGCDTAFWTINRKHHCRKCGKVFCAECSQYEASVPDEQLYQPVRVCQRCFAELRRHRRCPSASFIAATPPTTITPTAPLSNGH